jgi:hypothetical protein
MVAAQQGQRFRNRSHVHSIMRPSRVLSSFAVMPNRIVIIIPLLTLLLRANMQRPPADGAGCVSRTRDWTPARQRIRAVPSTEVPLIAPLAHPRWAGGGAHRQPPRPTHTPSRAL